MFAASRAWLPGFFGATGTGKTEQGACKVLEVCEATGCDALVCAPDFKMMRRATLKKYVELATPAAVDPLHPYHETKQCMELRFGSTIWFATADTPENLWGSQVGVVHGDEVCLIEPDAVEPGESKFLKAALSRARQPLPKGYVNQLIATGTPKGQDHWTYKVWADPNRDPELRENSPWWGMTIYENPYLPKSYIRMQELVFGTDSDFARQELYGEWIVQGGQRCFDIGGFGRYDSWPGNLITIVGSWDTAATTKEYSSFTVGQLWGVSGDFRYYLLDMVREKLPYPLVKERIRQVTRDFGIAINIIEDKASGQPALQDLAREGLRVAPFKPIQDKTARALQASVPVQEGRVLIPSRDYAAERGLGWLPDFEDEISRAPYIKNWDVVDAFSQFVLWAQQRRYSVAQPRTLSVRSVYGQRPRKVIYARAS